MLQTFELFRSFVVCSVLLSIIIIIDTIMSKIIDFNISDLDFNFDIVICF